MKPSPTDINRALKSIEHADAEYRKGTAIDPRYNFNAKPEALRQVFYDAAVRFSRRRWWARLLR